MTISTSSREDQIRAEAKLLGFDACRFASVAEAWPASGRLAEFVAHGPHGELGWMETPTERRPHPRATVPRARTRIVLGINSGPDHDPLAVRNEPTRGAISVYAQGDDYHELIKKRLK